MRQLVLCIAAAGLSLLAGCARPVGSCDPLECNDGVPCTNDTCDQVLGGCTHVPNDLVCGPGEYCDVLNGCVPAIPCTTALDCNDGLACNGVEVCSGGFCGGGMPPDCNDGVGCTTGVCDDFTGGCMQIPNHDDCGPGQTCDVVLGCVSAPMCTTPADCDDGMYCNGAEVCGGTVCAPGAPPDCNDGVACTVDGCDEFADTCTNMPNDAACAPGETCAPGVGCMPQCTFDMDCDDGDACTVDVCSGGSCIVAGSVSCDDMEDCTTDSCDPVLGCQNLPNANPCDDGLACTTGDVCSGGMCTGTPMTPPGMQTFNYTGAATMFVVPPCVFTVTIDAWGAQGGDGYPGASSAGGLGAHVVGDFTVTPGQTLQIIVGGTGSDGNVFNPSTLNGGGGGGGSFVIDAGTGMPMIIAGGGGGGCMDAGNPGDPGHADTSGGAGSYTAPVVGSGGFTDNCCGGGSGCGGGGWNSGGTGNTWCTGGGVAGGAGGTSSRGFGGFGGGGGVYHGGGGGGGYTGGSGGHPPPCGGGGGGGSFNAGTNVSATAGVRADDGMITISW